jgi:hypothetical protein
MEILPILKAFIFINLFTFIHIFFYFYIYEVILIFYCDNFSAATQNSESRAHLGRYHYHSSVF